MIISSFKNCVSAVQIILKKVYVLMLTDSFWLTISVRVEDSWLPGHLNCWDQLKPKDKPYGPVVLMIHLTSLLMSPNKIVS